MGIILSLLVLVCKSEDDSSNSIFVNVSKCNEGLSPVSHYDGLACGELKNTSGSSNVYISNANLNCAFSKPYAKISESSDTIEIVIRFGEQSDTEFSAKCNCYFDFVIPIESKTENISKIDIKFVDMANNVEEELVISPQDALNRCVSIQYMATNLVLTTIHRVLRTCIDTVVLMKSADKNFYVKQYLIMKTPGFV